MQQISAHEKEWVKEFDEMYEKLKKGICDDNVIREVLEAERSCGGNSDKVDV